MREEEYENAEVKFENFCTHKDGTYLYINIRDARYVCFVFKNKFITCSL